MLKVFITAISCLALGLVVGYNFAPEMATNTVEIPKAVESSSAAVSVIENNSQIAATAETGDAVAVDSAAETEQLKSRVALLEQELALKQQYTTMGFTATNQGQGVASRYPDKLSVISLEQAKQYVPEAYAELLSVSKGSIVDGFNKLHTESIDYDWAQLMEQRITDYVTFHTNASTVQLQSVLCKSSLCEIRGVELEDWAWNQIWSDMQREEWWQFRVSHAANREDSGIGKIFYTLASTNIPPEFQ
ncbi:hypothetical protein [Rheinheimera pacifica]|uniref:hypothetical protein n=1 Tax=Rheinheimera pacifica TaxID=173990 RepID=UPI002ED81F07